jgi:hypothetical protein
MLCALLQACAVCAAKAHGDQRGQQCRPGCLAEALYRGASTGTSVSCMVTAHYAIHLLPCMGRNPDSLVSPMRPWILVPFLLRCGQKCMRPRICMGFSTHGQKSVRCLLHSKLEARAQCGVLQRTHLAPQAPLSHRPHMPHLLPKVFGS